MGKFLTILTAITLVALPATEIRAQVSDEALNQARARLACGTGQAIAAETLPNGTIRVTCQQTNTLPSALGGLQLTPAAGGAAAAVFLCVVACGSDSETSTTTTNLGER